MRHFITLVERWIHQMRVDNHALDLYANPSKNEFMALIHQFGTLRGDITSDGDLVVWDANIATHSDVERDFGNWIGAYLYLHKNHVVMNDINYHTEHGGDTGYGRVFSNKAKSVILNPNLQKIYGKSFSIIGVDNANDEGHPLTLDLLDRIEKEMPNRISDIDQKI